MRLIDADELIEHLRKDPLFELVEQYGIVGVIDSRPTVDAEPVKHGRWLEYGENKDGSHNIRCSKCGEGLKSKGHANSYYTKHKYRYCPSCNARMDCDDDE